MNMQRRVAKQTEVEAGFASIVVAIVLVTILSLLTVGFAELMRHEQQSALNRQLSNAAYYAAESGLNDATKAIQAGYIKPKTDCKPLPAGSTGGAQFLTNNKVDTAPGDAIANYPCLLIDPAPFSLQFGAIGDEDDNGRSFVVNGIDPGDPNEVNPDSIRTLTFAWQNVNKYPNFAPSSWRTTGPGGSARFPTAANWKDPVTGGLITGVLRVEIVPIPPSGTGISRANLINQAFTAYFYPSRDGSAGQTGAVSYSGSSNSAPIIVDGRCNANNSPGFCSVKMSGLGASSYLIHLNSIYDISSVNIVGTDNAGKNVRLGNVQALIDSTGKSQGVLRRLQARLPGNTFAFPQFSFEATGGICKLLNVEPTGTQSSDSCP